MSSLRAAAAIAPFSLRFRSMPAIYAIYCQHHMLCSKAVAVEETYKGLTFSPHSGYLAAHQTRLRGLP